MSQSMKAAKARRRRSWQAASGVDASRDDHGAIEPGETPARDFMPACGRNGPSDIEPCAYGTPEVPPTGLGVRAENVLKELAVQLVGEIPPQGRWTPSDLLLQKLTHKDLIVARNCGPQTTAEIIEWAEKRGKPIPRSFAAGKSLSAVWQYTIAKCSEGNISRADIAEALEKSTRRGNTRVPVAFQRILLEFVNSAQFS